MRRVAVLAVLLVDTGLLVATSKAPVSISDSEPFEFVLAPDEQELLLEVTYRMRGRDTDRPYARFEYVGTSEGTGPASLNFYQVDEDYDGSEDQRQLLYSRAIERTGIETVELNDRLDVEFLGALGSATVWYLVALEGDEDADLIAEGTLTLGFDDHDSGDEHVSIEGIVVHSD